MSTGGPAKPGDLDALLRTARLPVPLGDREALFNLHLHALALADSLPLERLDDLVPPCHFGPLNLAQVGPDEPC